MNISDIKNSVKNIIFGTTKKDTASKITVSKSKIESIINECIVESRLKFELKPLILETLKEIKIEQEKTVEQDMDDLNKAIVALNKDAEVVKTDAKTFNINGFPVFKFSIRPMSPGVYDVLFFKDTSDREKKLGLNYQDVKKYIQDKIKDKTGNYTQKAFNKSAENDIDKTEKVSDSIITKQNSIKSVNTEKNDNKDYKTDAVDKDDDLPSSPMKSVDKFKKQIEYPIKGTKPDYEYPKQKDKKLTIKPRVKGKGLKKLGN